MGPKWELAFKGIFTTKEKKPCQQQYITYGSSWISSSFTGVSSGTEFSRLLDHIVGQLQSKSGFEGKEEQEKLHFATFVLSRLGMACLHNY